MWKSIGKFQSNHLSVCSIQDLGIHSTRITLKHSILLYLDPIYFNATLIKRSPVTHDTDWYTFSIPSNIFMSPPIGYHIRLRRLKEGKSSSSYLYYLSHSVYLDVSIVKPYTVVNRLNDKQNSSIDHTIELLIKHYSDRIMTPMLQKLNIGIKMKPIFFI